MNDKASHASSSSSVEHSPLTDSVVGNPGQRTILELGSGVGLTGVFVQQMPFLYPSVRRLYITDYQSIILENANENLRLNPMRMCNSEHLADFGDSNSESSDSSLENANELAENVAVSSRVEGAPATTTTNSVDAKIHVHKNEHACESLNTKLDHPSIHGSSETIDHRPIIKTMHLDWLKFSRDELDQLDIDVILAADVVYDVPVIDPLCRLVHHLVASKPHVSCYFFITKRREETFEIFRNAIETRGLRCENVSDYFLGAISKKPSLFAVETLYDRDSVRIFKISST